MTTNFCSKDHGAGRTAERLGSVMRSSLVNVGPPGSAGRRSRASNLRVLTLRMGNCPSKLTPRLESKELWGICEDDQATYCTRGSTGVSSGGGRSSVGIGAVGRKRRVTVPRVPAPINGRPNREQDGPARPQAFPMIRDLRGSGEPCRSIARRTEMPMPRKQSGDAHSSLQSSWRIRRLPLPKPFCNSRPAVAP